MQLADKGAVLDAVLKNQPHIPIDEAELLVSRAEEYFCAETKRRCVPGRAQLLWIEIALAIAYDDANAGTKEVSSVKRGDTTIQYGGAKSSKIAALRNRIALYRVVRCR